MTPHTDHTVVIGDDLHPSTGIAHIDYLDTAPATTNTDTTTTANANTNTAV